MKRSFEENIGDRLRTHWEQPPSGAKDAIFDQLTDGDQTVYTVYQGVGAVLLLLAFFQIGMVRNVPITTLPNQDILTERTSTDGLHPTHPISEELSDNVQNENLSEVAKTKEEETVKNVPPIKDQEHQKETQSTNSMVSDPFKDRMFDERILSGHEGPEWWIADQDRRINITNKLKSEKRIIPEKKKWITPYFNLGTFFTYNRVKPNLDDEIYVSDYDSPFGISASRLGFALEAGATRQWGEIFSTRIGISANNFNQQYSFNVRSTRPDEVIVNSEMGYLEPQFETETIAISQRVTTAGIKVTGLWHIFPSRSNVLFAAFEYQRLLGAGPVFEYDQQEYQLMRPSQYFVEAGLRKTLLEWRNSEFYVMPNIRYSLVGTDDQLLNVKPFSVGVTLSYEMK